MTRSIGGRLGLNALGLALVLLILSVAGVARAADVGEKSNKADLARRLETLATKLEEQRVLNHIPGLAVAVVRGDEIVFARGFGLRNVEKRLPVEPETLFAVGSTTKAFTSALAFMLAADGKLSLDDPVRKHVAGFRLKDAEADSKVVLRDLLCHRTGLTRMGLLWAGGTLTDAQILDHVREAEPYKPFRTTFLYNNVMYLTAGMALGQAAGSDWHRLVKARIFEPLGMKSSNTSIGETENRLTSSCGYSWNEVDEKWELEEMRDLRSIAPAGAINSNSLDMAQWVRFQLAKGRIGEKQLLAAEAFDEMWKPHTVIAPNVTYALGWMIHEWKGRTVVEHGGNIDGFSAQVGLLPEENLGYCLLANVTATPLQQASLSLVWETLLGDEPAAKTGEDKGAAAKEPSKPAALPASELTRYVGQYYFPQMKADLTVLEKDGRLAVDVPGQTVYVLEWPNEKGRWVFAVTNEIEVAFELPDAGGEATAMTLYQSGMQFTMQRKRPATDLPSVDDVLKLREKAGLFDPTGKDAHARSRGTVRFVHQGASGRFESIACGDRFLHTMDMGALGKIRIAYDGKRGFTDSPGDRAKEVSGKELFGLSHEIPAAVFGNWRKHWKAVEVTGKEEYRGRASIVVRLTDAAGDANTLFVDAETGRIAGRKHWAHQSGLSLPMETRFEYENGALLPKRTITEIPQSGDLILEVDTYEAGLSPFEDSIFVLIDSNG